VNEVTKDETRIVAAAIRTPDAAVHVLDAPSRHHHIIEHLAERAVTLPVRGVQGFVDNFGRFWERAQAKKIARRAGQLLPTASDHVLLFTEDLW
jgi:hypothetical protein